MNVRTIAWNTFKYLKRIQQFTNMLEKGDLQLADVIDYGIGFYGSTKTGKTTSCHMLSGNPLRV